MPFKTTTICTFESDTNIPENLDYHNAINEGVNQLQIQGLTDGTRQTRLTSTDPNVVYNYEIIRTWTTSAAANQFKDILDSAALTYNKQDYIQSIIITEI